MAKKQMAAAKMTQTQVAAAADAFTKALWDVRAFGGVHPQFKGGYERSTGSIQVSPAVSLDPVEVVSHGLTRTAGAGGKEDVENEVDVGGPDEGPTGLRANMGRKAYVRYGVYRFHASYTPKRGAMIGMRKEDLVAFWEGLTCGWADARSSNRTGVNLRQIYVFSFRSARSVSEIRLREAVKASMGEWNASSFDKVNIQLDHESISDIPVDWYCWKDGQVTTNVLGGSKMLPSDPGRRWIAVGFIECSMSNPNGDPDNSGAPRVLSTGEGVISYESIKRVIRDYVRTEYDGKPGMGLFIERGSNLTETQARFLAEAAGAEADKDQGSDE